MKNYLILHYGFIQPTPEDMDKWTKWFKSISDRQAEMHMLGDGREITHTGTKELIFGRDSLTGFTRFQAENLEEAEKIARDCPIVASNNVYEIRM
jgi:hypothetical protein